MPEIKSSIGGRSFTASAGQRVIDVPDETEGSEMHSHSGPVGYPAPAHHMPQHMHATAEEINQAELREHHRQMQAAARRGPAISQQAKSRIEFLTNLGRKTKDVPVEGAVFSLKTLKGSETRAAIMATANVDNLERPFEARKQYLARALYAIDNYEISLALGTDSLEAKLEFVEELDDNVIAFVYGEWVKLNNEASAAFSVKTDEDMKEVLEDVKK